ncbi:cytochrome c biogenesis CcdA family protein [Polymorphum gilvum]|uniref:Cytochrome C biogenesis protein transmembrane region n=1 Tax=Polymorphum gilvum (strain LMG 25793 / CGMCC 1.9160 / SL003B-26A1) TaxID=991905 RepID=F2J0S0_POLGS|nr:cytochrome c biogenesis protein CcdA [Polymorphum gilvum]ADZ70756.1 Cytochrome C biogenesis protein transmembrane region [Polymorphum gilvum SL003B-26A1]
MLQDVTLLGALFAGILSFISPCVLPLVPPYLGFLAGTSLEELTGEGGESEAGRRVFLSALAFVAGFSTVFVLLGASASLIGQFVTQHIQFLGYVAGVMIIVMGLHFLGVFRIGLLYREARVHVARKPAGLAGAYLIGLAFAFGWTPCVGPILAAILFVAGSEETVAQGALLLSAYALGLGIPFLAAALFAGPFLAFMKRFRRHMGAVEKAMGVVLVATGVMFLTGQMAVLSYWLLETFPQFAVIG